jgi:hypothetical protein
MAMLSKNLLDKLSIIILSTDNSERMTSYEYAVFYEFASNKPPYDQVTMSRLVYRCC